jgi:hypothetical protein
VPTLAESGLPNYGFDAWIAVVRPAGLPKPMVQKYYTDFKTVLAQEEVQDALAAQGIAVLAGDGIGPEIVAEAVKVLGGAAGTTVPVRTEASAPMGAAAYLLRLPYGLEILARSEAVAV